MLPTIPIRWLLCCLFLLAACEDSAGLGTGKPDGLMDAASRDMSIPGNGEGNISNSDSSAPFSASDIEGNWFACEGPDCTRLMDWGVRFTLEGTFQELLVNEWRDSKSGVTSFCEDKEAIFSYVISANSPQIHLDSSSQHLTVGTYELQIIESKLLLKMDGRAFYFKKDLQAQKVEQCTAIKGFECEDGSWADITDMPACYAFLTALLKCCPKNEAAVFYPLANSIICKNDKIQAEHTCELSLNNPTAMDSVCKEYRNRASCF